MRNDSRIDRQKYHRGKSIIRSISKTLKVPRLFGTRPDFQRERQHPRVLSSLSESILPMATAHASAAMAAGPAVDALRRKVRAPTRFPVTKCFGSGTARSGAVGAISVHPTALHPISP